MYNNWRTKVQMTKIIIGLFNSKLQQHVILFPQTFPTKTKYVQVYVSQLQSLYYDRYLIFTVTIHKKLCI